MILLADANILFDFGWVGGLRELVSLGPFEVLENVLDEVQKDEELREIAATLLGLGVTVVPLEDDWMQAVYSAKRGKLSVPDATCLHYARLKTRTVLTSERRLRERCQAEGVDVHGSLWAVQELHARGLCEASVMCTWFPQWISQGARLPEHAVRELRRTLGCP
ncbi:PIN domain-containing protein [Deinococcus saxicola]|uniref:hypothetical protein n=1 Tax=Deinococcus saxicola TaxID=249406 RepID=UPI0039F0A717